MPATPLPVFIDDAPLTLRILGGSSVTRGTETLIGPGKPVALLTYLACAPRRTAGRDHLIDLLWADLDPERARHALRQTIWYLKRQTGRAVVDSENGHLLLATDIACDRDAFLEAIESREMARAVELYTGPFVPDFAAPGGAEFEKWADMERYRLQTLFQQAIEETARAHLAQGHHRDAITLARRARALAPGNEATWRLLFESLLSAGDRVGATIEREAFDRLLADEELTPEPATTALLARLDGAAAQDEPAPPTAGRLAAELVGRELEFGQIVQGWDRARLGPALHFHITGGPGIGKTRLLTDVHHRLRASGARIAMVRATPGARALSFGLAGDLAASLASLPGGRGIPDASASALVGLNPALASLYRAPSDTATGDEALRRRILALADLLGAVTDEGPVAIVIDDLHWSDAASRALLDGLLDRLEGMRALVITASRAGAEGTIGRTDTRRIDLAPLDQGAIGALVTSLADLPVAPWADALPAALLRSTGGNPLAVLESLQLALDAELLQIADGSWKASDPAALDRTLSEGAALEHRIRRLDRGEHWALLVLSQAGTPLDEPTLVAMTSQGAVTAIEQRGLASRTGTMLAPTHDEVARLVAESAAPEALIAARRLNAERVAKAADADRAMLARTLRSIDLERNDHLGHTLATRFVTLARAEGDRRTARDLLAEALGTDPWASEVTALLGTGRWRAKWARHRWLVVGPIAATVVLWALVLGLRPAAPVGPTLVSFVYPPDGHRRGVVSMRAGPREAVGDLVLLRPAAETLWSEVPSAQIVGRAFRRVDGAEATQVISPDSGGVDIMYRDAAGLVHRLTADREDQNAAGWTPDGRYILGTSGTNSGPATTDYDIFSLDADNGRLRYLTTGPEHDQAPYLSPDGTRLLFLRMSLTKIGPRLFCISWFDGTEPACTEVPGGDAIAPAGWVDRRTALVVTRTTRGPQLELLSAGDLHRTPLRASAGTIAYLSPDGRWVLCHCRTERPATWQLFEVGAPERLIEVKTGAGDVPKQLFWADSAPASKPWLERLKVQGPATVLRGETARYSADGFDAHGAAVGDLELRWTSGDSTMLRVERRTGVARGLRTGTTWLIASAGGWRRDSIAVRVAPGEGGAVVTERWREGWDERWHLGGTPQPVRVMADGQPAININGDGSFVSGIDRWPGWTTPSFGAEFTLRTRFDRVNWQTISLEIDLASDSVAFARWDRHTGQSPRSIWGSCGAIFGGESTFWREHLQVSAGQEQATPRIDGALADGRRWYRIRLQVFPDGGCGIAVDGVPIWLSTAKIPRSAVPHLLAYGMSYQTQVLIRQIDTWEGVRNDVDWTKAPTTVELGEE